MSEFEYLINQSCPQNYPIVSLGSLMTRIREKGKNDNSIEQVYVVSNTQGIVKAEDFRENTIHSSDTSNYTIIRPGMVAYNPSRLNIGSIAMLKSDLPGLVSPMYVVFSINEEKIIKEYFEYIITSSYVKNRIESFKEEGARFRFDYSRWDWINISLPPKHIQEEIIKKLDTLSKYLNLLETENKKRNLQYEYCRTQLLKCDISTPKVKLKDVTKSFRGDYITKSKSKPGNIPVILGGQEPAYYIDKHNHTGEIVVIARSGASAGFVSYWNEPIFVTDGFGFEALENIILPEYLYYSLKNIEKTLNSMKRGAGVPHVSGSALGEVELLLPSMEQQQSIVYKLKAFEQLCCDEKSGILREIELRKKQFEFCRGKLISLGI